MALRFVSRGEMTLNAAVWGQISPDTTARAVAKALTEADIRVSESHAGRVAFKVPSGRWRGGWDAFDGLNGGSIEVDQVDGGPVLRFVIDRTGKMLISLALLLAFSVLSALVFWDGAIWLALVVFAGWSMVIIVITQLVGPEMFRSWLSANVARGRP